MIVKRVEKTPVTNEELNEYKKRISKLDKDFAVNALDVGMDKRIVTIKFGGEYDDLTLVNPTVTETSEAMVVYFEKDSIKNKQPNRIITKKIGRNDPCPCGSGKKYKVCHGS